MFQHLQGGEEDDDDQDAQLADELMYEAMYSDGRSMYERDQMNCDFYPQMHEDSDYDDQEAYNREMMMGEEYDDEYGSEMAFDPFSAFMQAHL